MFGFELYIFCLLVLHCVSYLTFSKLYLVINLHDLLVATFSKNAIPVVIINYCIFFIFTCFFQALLGSILSLYE